MKEEDTDGDMNALKTAVAIFDYQESVEGLIRRGEEIYGLYRNIPWNVCHFLDLPF